MTRPAVLVAGAALAVGGVAVCVAGAYQPVEAPLALGMAAAVVAAAVTAGMVIVAVSSPWLGLLLFVAGMPIVSVARAEVWIGPVQVLPSTLAIAALVLGVLLQPAPSQQAVGGPKPAARAWMLLALGAGLAVAATLLAPLDADPLNITLHGVLEPMAIFGVVIALRPSALQILHALLALAGSVTIATLINLSWLAVLLVPLDLYEQRLLLARLTYFNAGIFGTMLVMAIPAAVGVALLRDRLPWPRLAQAGSLAALALIVAALFFTYTKSAWLSAALVATLLIVLLVPGWSRRLPMLLGVAILLAVVVPYPLPVLRGVAPGLASGYESFLVALQGPGRLESWDPETYQGSGSIGIRLEAAGAAAELAAGSPLLGVGPGGFQAEFARIRPDAAVPGLQSAHNLLPNLAAEYGLPLALVVAFGLVRVIAVALRIGRSAAAIPRVVGTVLGVSLIGFASMATLFGVDLYRAYRTMNLDVVAAAFLAGLSFSLGRLGAGRS